jgi:hypothetical protein
MASDDDGDAIEGQANPIARIKKGKLPIPTPHELVKDKLKELALEHGWDALKWAYKNVTKPLRSTPTPTPKAAAGGGGGAIALIALLAIASTKKGGRRGRRR